MQISSSTIVLITGANSGVGLASTEVIASASPQYHVIIAGRNSQSIETALAELKAKDSIKGSLSTLQLDVDSADSISAAAKEVEQQFGRVDVLVNNAGIASSQGTQDALDQIMRTNVTGAALVAEAFRPILLKSKNPYSVYVSSSLGSLGKAADKSDPAYHADYITYRMSKSALNMWALQEHKNFQGQGLKTFAFCPGLVVSNLRGKDEDSRQAYGRATSPLVSGQTLLSIIEGKRDADVGKMVHKDGVYPW